MNNENKTNFVVSDFGAIHDALNNIIIGELKAALRLVPGQAYEKECGCHIVVSENDDYAPQDVCVDSVWLDDNNNFCFSGHLPLPAYADDNDTPEQYEGGEEAGTDWLDITDFQYLIEQIAEHLPADGKTHNLRIDAQAASDFNHFAVMNDAVNKIVKYNFNK